MTIMYDEIMMHADFQKFYKYEADKGEQKQKDFAFCRSTVYKAVYYMVSLADRGVDSA
jgi:hypothetical protein